MPTFATRRAAKFWVGGAGVITSAVLAAWAEAPRPLFIANAAIVAIAVYLVPNEAPNESTVEGSE